VNIPVVPYGTKTTAAEYIGLYSFTAHTSTTVGVRYLSTALEYIGRYSAAVECDGIRCDTLNIPVDARTERARRT